MEHQRRKGFNFDRKNLTYFIGGKGVGTFQSLVFLMKVNHIAVSNCKLIGNRLFSMPDMTLVAEIELKNFSHFEFHYISENDRETYRSIKVFKYKPDVFQRSDTPLYNYDGLYVCQNCNRPIVKVYSDSLLGYSVYVKCLCGEIYDCRRMRKAESEKSEVI